MLYAQHILFPNRLQLCFPTHREQSFLPFHADLILNPLHMTSTQALDLTTQLELSFDLSIVQDAETVDHSHGPTGNFHDLVKIKFQVM